MTSLTITFSVDGDKWCAVYAEGFTNIQECPAGFGSTPELALSNLISQEDKFGDGGVE